MHRNRTKNHVIPVWLSNVVNCNGRIITSLEGLSYFENVAYFSLTSLLLLHARKQDEFRFCSTYNLLLNACTHSDHMA